MNLRNILVLIISFSLGFILYAQDDVTEEASSDTTETMDESMGDDMSMEEELLEYEEEESASALDGFSAGFTGSVGFVNATSIHRGICQA